MDKVNKKLSSNAGESIAETMVAVLIAALALTMLAAAIYSATNIINLSRTKLNNYFDANECLVKESIPTGTSEQIASEQTGQPISISVKGNDTNPSTSVAAGGTVTCIHNNVFNNNIVTIYKFVPTQPVP